MAKNVHIWCGYVEGEGLYKGLYFGGFRVVVPEAMMDTYGETKRDFDQTLSAGNNAFRTPKEATEFAQKQANVYLRMLAAFGIVSDQDLTQTFWEEISPN